MTRSKKRDSRSKSQGPTPQPDPHQKADPRPGQKSLITETNPTPTSKQKGDNPQSPRFSYVSRWAFWKGLLEIVALFVGFYAVRVYKGQWDAAKRANDIAAKNFNASQRAWVGIDRFTFAPLQPETPLIWEAVLKNFGNSPAKSVEIRDNAELVVSPQVDPTMAWMLTASLPQVSGKTLTMFNGQVFTNRGGKNFILTAGQVDDVSHGRSILVYIAEIKYRDIFEQTHTTMICQVMDAFGTHDCGFGETAD